MLSSLSVNHAGQVVLKLKTPYRDGTSHLVISPLEFMQRLAALVPRPRLHLIRFRKRTAYVAGERRGSEPRSTAGAGRQPLRRNSAVTVVKMPPRT